MVLHLVTKRKATPSLSIDRALLPEEEDALRRVKEGIDLPGEDPVYRATVASARAKDLWILCDCRSGSPGERPVISLRKHKDGRIFLVNIPSTEVPHAQGCLFAPGEGARRRMPEIVFGDVLRPVASRRKRADEEEQGKGPQRRFDGARNGQPELDPGRPSAQADAGRKPAQAERLGRVRIPRRMACRNRAGGPDLPHPGGLQDVRPPGHGSEEMDVGLCREGPGPAGAGVAEESTPCAWLCWMARDIDGCEVNRAHPALGHVRVLADVTFPTVMGRRVEGPWLFLGEVGRSPETGRWECLEACARPIASACCPVPVDSHNERRALGALRSLIRSLETDAELGEALGGAIRIDLEKPLFDIHTVGGPCRPDFILTVIRPGCRPAGRRHLLGDAARYVIEVMGLDDPEYENEPRRRPTGA